MDPFLAQIIMFGGNFAPRGWAFCDGQLLPISQYTALFSILGTTYGGDGRTTFALPDLRGRVPVHAGSGSGPGLSLKRVGEKGGAENVTLSEAQMPAHNHAIHGSNVGGDDSDPTTGNGFGTAANDLYIETAPSTNMGSGVMSNAGGGQAHTNMQPFGCVNFIIALQGVFPSRS
ncbi:microcystin-dependent protein [Owenweeksia hongkongensis DSM 17368]|uniref:Microcystin-dependent protein n=1 Tax=Owenweeksia hongkongensis (strain DSM 17368 / CIP 108786 / JCM 12287 / NRRL B-23963 / UST20020801) TaxID=926562 RepID=G8R087_OWEHD|nr:tail fiber protein [Owenweeksia hongkongensis]AEV33753.1 microcystin-dependent protein [Owenweeksia hongkongensis DSM 17368]